MQEIGYADVARMMRAGAEAVKARRDELSKLDSATGDGDHGTSASRAMDALLTALDEAGPDSDLADLFQKIGWAILGIDGGSTGPLVGSLFMGMGEAIGDRKTLDASAVADMFAGGVAKIGKQSRAQVGDKTMMDALIPAADAIAAARESGIAEMLQQGARAAAAGAEATSDMQAKFGRARNLGERSKGHVDPGARSMACLVAGFYEGLTGQAF